ncbi:uncharacterized protein [Rutidosis leptorrhynchoides]|uniref:uncharacterized protein n=1 Tax=Rutidosis leptorrhynchoides TaxID=125765 RepID=UPI003A99B0BD
MAKWAIELGEHEIDFQAHHSIKAQVLADFMAKITETNEESDSTFTQIITPSAEMKEWKLFTDGASSSDGSGAELMLINPEGQEFTYALRFEFNTTNSEAEYEALLAGLSIAKEMKIEHLQALVDSQLIANQVLGVFEARQHTIQLYLSKVRELIESFRSFTIEHVRRSQNKKADALSKLASITFAHLAKEVLVEVLEKRSIEIQEVHDMITEEENTWMKPLREYLDLGILPEDKKEARKVEVTNRDILKALKKRLGKCHQGWMEELPLVLWAHRTTPKRSNGETPYSLVYDTEAVLPAEIQVLTNRTTNLEENEENLRLNLDLMEERREAVLIREAAYKKTIEKYYNKGVKPSVYKVGDYVLRLNSTRKVEYEGKSGPTWEGPYIISEAFGNGSYKLETTEGKQVPRTWNGVNLRKFYFKISVVLE